MLFSAFQLEFLFMVYLLDNHIDRHAMLFIIIAFLYEKAGRKSESVFM